MGSTPNLSLKASTNMISSWGRRARPRRKPKPPSRSHWPSAVPGSPAPNPRDAPAHQNSAPACGPHRPQPAAPTYGPSPPSDPTSRQPKRSPPTASRNAAQPRTPSEQPDPAAPPDTSPASSALS